MNTALKNAIDALTDVSEKYSGRPMPADVGSQWEDGIRKVEALYGRQVDDPGNRPADAKARPDGSPGELFAKSSALRSYLEAGAPRGPSSKASVGSFLTTKAVPSFTGNVIAPGRDPDVARSSGLDRLRLADALPTVETTSNSVEYLKVTSAEPQVAAPVAEGGSKPESTMAVEAATAPVRTLAAWMPVTEQQLSDLPQIRQLVDTELLHDIARLAEYQMIWGDGTGENLLGFMNVSGVNAGRSVAGDSLVDRVRRAITDISAEGAEPDTLVIHPQDLEDLLLTKGTDDHYLAQAFPTVAGPLRVWGLRVVESVAAEAYRSADTTDQRVILVLDSRRSATIFNRQQATVEVGFIGTQFVENKRTIRAEERIAFAVRRPFAVKYIETVAAVA